MKEKYVNAITDETGMGVYAKAFTHVSIDPENNYEFLEILGDVTCNKIVVWYIKDRFPVLQNTAGVKVIARLRINLVSKKHFSALAESLGFWKYISSDMEVREQRGRSILEDSFEAFFGATELLLDERVSPGAGYGICFKILKSIFDTLPISLRYEDLYDPITRLKETFDYYRSRQCPILWGTMCFENHKTERGTQFVKLFQQDKCNPHRKQLLSTAEAALLDDAKQVAASQALVIVEKQGYRRPIPEYYEMILQSSLAS